MTTTGLGLYPFSQNQPQRHNVFVSYHHDNDQYWRDRFENLFVNHYDIMVSKSVQIGDIPENTPTDRIRQIIRDNYLPDTTVTVVLIGSETWKRKHVDWEISMNIRQTKNNSRSGLLGIILPNTIDGTTSYQPSSEHVLTDDGQVWYNPHTIPPRLYDNVKCGFAKIYKWSEDPSTVKQWIHEAFLRRNQVNPDNSYPSFAHNRSGDRWY